MEALLDKLRKALDYAIGDSLGQVFRVEAIYTDDDCGLLGDGVGTAV